jgi:predicted  nucleic acid-binding Zn-ribbon protein
MDLSSRISSTKAGVQDLRSQIADFRAHSSDQREDLNRELEAHREQKRQEELTRSDLKSRTKSLEDSKRSAESAKRDAERKLKSAETRRDEVTRKITYLRNEITKSRSNLGDDREWVENIQSGGVGDGDHGKGGQVHLEEELQERKAEIKVVEDVIAALTVRAEELEDKVMKGRERLKVILEQAHRAKLWQESNRDPIPTSLPTGPPDRGDNLSWPPTQPSPTSSVPTLDQPPESDPQDLQDGHSSPKSIPLSTGPPTSKLLASGDLTRPNPPAKFAPFDDLTSLAATDGEMLQSTFLIPSGLINSLPNATPDMDLSRSFKVDGDPFIIQPDRLPATWRRNSGADAQEITSHQQPALDPFSSTPNLVEPSRDLGVTSAPRRWFSVKEKKKLNPEAEAFNLPTPKSFFKPTVPTFFDALNPSKSGVVSSMGSNSSRRLTESVAHSSFFSKAFAPSPAERAALGAGRFHTSLEKLPSLSDVPGSLHASPVSSHTTPSSNQDPVTVVPGTSLAKSMAWLNSLPRRKPKFSPWDDDEEH